ncbi:amidohydrolase [Candidatus Bathyarchaeota archaeon]|nr:amidohydrolase [Candidatus Bathyarchaeota archaeon]
MNIIDSHTHLGTFPLFNVSMDSAEMISIMNQYGIKISVVFSLPNELTLDAVKKYPERLIGLVWINPHEGNLALQKVDRAINEWGFKGIKMHPLLDSFLPDQEIVYPVMERARKYRVPILFHCGHPPWSLPWHFSNLAEVYPDVTIILGHMGHGHIVYINGSIDVARKHENIILETSAMPMHRKIKEAVEKVGEDRVIYGSDMPFGHPSFEIRKVEVSGLSEKQIEMVLSVNARKIFRL